jgi:hypothetical protein
LDPSLKEAQGPALIAYNDGVLRPEDWKALRTIHSSSKKTDEESVPFLFISIRCNLNGFADKQGKMGLVSARLIMYEYSVLIDES